MYELNCRWYQLWNYWRPRRIIKSRIFTFRAVSKVMQISCWERNCLRKTVQDQPQDVKSVDLFVCSWCWCLDGDKREWRSARLCLIQFLFMFLFGLFHSAIRQTLIQSLSFSPKLPLPLQSRTRVATQRHFISRISGVFQAYFVIICLSCSHIYSQHINQSFGLSTKREKRLGGTRHNVIAIPRFKSEISRRVLAANICAECRSIEIPSLSFVCCSTKKRTDKERIPPRYLPERHFKPKQSHSLLAL